MYSNYFYRDCDMCKYKTNSKSCLAFPKGIPSKIFFGRERHDKILPGQIGDYLYSPDTNFIQMATQKKEYEKGILEARGKLINDIPSHFIQEIENQGYDFDDLKKAILDVEIPKKNLYNNYRLEVVTKMETIKLKWPKIDSRLFLDIRGILAAQRLENKPYRLELIVYSDKTSSINLY